MSSIAKARAQTLPIAEGAFLTTSIFVDSRRAQGVRTGVGHYAKSILQHWPSDFAEVTLLQSDAKEPEALNVGRRG